MENIEKLFFTSGFDDNIYGNIYDKNEVINQRNPLTNSANFNSDVNSN